MTTKRARSRRLVPSEHYDHMLVKHVEIPTRRHEHRAMRERRFSANRGRETVYVTLFMFSKWELRPSGRRVQLWASRFDGDGGWSEFYAPTRLALHDAILRAGWPSPWREVAR